MIKVRLTLTRAATWRPSRYRMARAGLWSIVVLYAALTVLLVSGCATMVAPRDTNDALAYAEGQVQGIARACARLNDERRISLESAVRCQSGTNQAFTAIDVGRGAFAAGDLTKAQAQLELARTLLLELEKITGGQK